jgi:hypothetical protein
VSQLAAITVCSKANTTQRQDMHRLTLAKFKLVGDFLNNQHPGKGEVQRQMNRGVGCKESRTNDQQ